MNQDLPATSAAEPSEPVSPPAVSESSQEPPASPPPPVAARRGAPSWLPYVALAIIPALIVGTLVYFFAGGSDSSGGAGIIDGFIRLNSTDEEITSFEGKIPPNFPSDLPQYKDAKLISSLEIASGQGTLYMVFASTSDSPQKVYEFFLGALDDDPWQVELAQDTADLSGIVFSSPDDADVQGDVRIIHSTLDNRTSIYYRLQDLTPTSRSSSQDKDAIPTSSRPLPPGFPNDIPIYDGKKSESIVTDTYFQRDPGAIAFYVSFLSKDTQNEILAYYKGEFEKRGWTVTESTEASRGFSETIEFSDGAKQQIQGAILADAFAADPSYTKIELQMQVSTSRSRGN